MFQHTADKDIDGNPGTLYRARAITENELKDTPPDLI